MTWKSHFVRFSNINMSSPSLPMVPQWLKLAFGVKRALAVLLAFEKTEAQARWFGMSVLMTSWGISAPPLTLPGPPRDVGPPMRLDRASATCVCVNTHTVTQVFLVGSLTCLVFPQRDCRGGYLSHVWEGIGGKELWFDSLKYMNCDMPPVAARHHRPAAGSWQQAARGSVDFRLMWKWKNQRRRRTRQSRLWFIISSGGAHNMLYDIDIYVLDDIILDCIQWGIRKQFFQTLTCWL